MAVVVRDVGNLNTPLGPLLPVEESRERGGEEGKRRARGPSLEENGAWRPGRVKSGKGLEEAD